MVSENLVRLFEHSMKSNWELPAFTDYIEKKTYTYVVKKGDTLTAIAEKYHTTVSNIAKENGIKNPDLIFGNQVLKITV